MTAPAWRIAAVLAIAVSTSPASHGGQALAGPAARRAVLSLAPLTDPRGATSNAVMVLRPGDTMVMSLTLVSTGDCYVVGSGSGDASFDAARDRIQPEAGRWWLVSGTLVSVDVDHVVAEIAWRYEVRRPEGVVLVRRDARRVTFSPGRPAILDALRADELGVACDGGLFAVSLDGRALPDESREREWLRYDIWLEHSSRLGVVRRHVREERLHGEHVGVDFAPIHQVSLRDDCGVEIDVKVTAQAMVRPDGNIDLATTQVRAVGLAPTGERARLLSGFGSGRKALTVKSGEAIKFLLPVEGFADNALPPSSACGTPAGSTRLRDVMADQDTAITLRITRLGTAG